MKEGSYETFKCRKIQLHRNYVSTKIFFTILNYYDENFKAREEEEMRIRFEKKYKIQNLCVPLYRYWIHDNNLTKNNMKMDFFKEKLTKKHG